jgi:hypothetical protein
MFQLSAIHPPVANVLTAVYAPGVPAVTSVSAFVASSSKVDIPTATAVTNVSGAPAGAGDHAIAVGPAFNVVPAVIASLLLLANAQLLMLLLAISLVVPALAVAGPQYNYRTNTFFCYLDYNCFGPLTSKNY